MRPPFAPGWLAMAALLGCGEPPVALRVPDGGAPATSPIRAEAPVPIAPPVEVRAGDRVAIAAGTLRVGSRPGTAGRRPSVEADLREVSIGAYSIDRLPYPNDPTADVLRVPTRDEARALCEARGQRLCHELEWERACKLDGDATFATGETMELTTCLADPTACASPAGVMDLGIRGAEWTATDAEPRLARMDRTAVVRGGARDAELAEHRCSARQVRSPAGSEPLAFRCCAGESAAVAYPDVGRHRTHRDLELPLDRLRSVIASVPELAPYAAAFVPFGRNDAVHAIARGGGTERAVHWAIAPGPFAWSPSTGEEVWVFAGASGESTIIAAIYPMPDGSFRHAGSFVFADEAMPVALLRTPDVRHEILWTACWGCGGESGVVRFGEDARIVVAQQ